MQFVEASHNALWKEAVENADIIKLGEFEAPLIGREHLVAMWLFAGRIKDFQKITMFWDAEILDKSNLFDILERHDLTSKWHREKWRFINEE